MIFIPRKISRVFITQHPELTFLYGQDEMQKGMFGQAWEAHNESNTIPIFTCIKMCRSSGYYQDSMFKHIVEVNQAQISKAIEREKPIIIFPKVGEGHSRLKEFAPKAFKWLRAELDRIQHKEIKWIYD